MATTYAARRFASANNNRQYDIAQDASIIGIHNVPQEFRAPILGHNFFESADDPLKQYRGNRTYEPAKLWNEVIKKKGNVEAETARLFVNDFLSSVFANDVKISDKRARQNLSSLGFEIIIKLYERISKSTSKGNSLYLQQLNKALHYLIHSMRSELSLWRNSSATVNALTWKANGPKPALKVA